MCMLETTDFPVYPYTNVLVFPHKQWRKKKEGWNSVAKKLKIKKKKKENKILNFIYFILKGMSK